LNILKVDLYFVNMTIEVVFTFLTMCP